MVGGVRSGEIFLPFILVSIGVGGILWLLLFLQKIISGKNITTARLEAWDITYLTTILLIGFAGIVVVFILVVKFIADFFH